MTTAELRQWPVYRQLQAYEESGTMDHRTPRSVGLLRTRWRGFSYGIVAREGQSRLAQLAYSGVSSRTVKKRTTCAETFIAVWLARYGNGA